MPESKSPAWFPSRVSSFSLGAIFGIYIERAQGETGALIETFLTLGFVAALWVAAVAVLRLR